MYKKGRKICVNNYMAYGCDFVFTDQRKNKQKLVGCKGEAEI